MRPQRWICSLFIFYEWNPASRTVLFNLATSQNEIKIKIDRSTEILLIFFYLFFIFAKKAKNRL